MGDDYTKPPTSEFLTIQEFADWAKVSRSTVGRWLKRGYVPHVVIGGHVRISRAAMDALRLVIVQDYARNTSPVQPKGRIRKRGPKPKRRRPIRPWPYGRAMVR